MKKEWRAPTTLPSLDEKRLRSVKAKQMRIKAGNDFSIDTGDIMYSPKKYLQREC